MSFHVGQKVVCVNAKRRTANGTMGSLEEGQIYTVRWIGSYAHRLDGFSRPHLQLSEIIRPCGDDVSPSDTPYLCDRFRPLIERKTDISALTALLNPNNHKEMVDLI